MSKEKRTDDYISGLYERNQVYMEKELEYAEKCHRLEKQLGCPLDAVFKAVTNGVYYGENADWMSWSAVDLHLNLEGKYVFYSFDEQCLFTKDYQKTWWLKEDRSE